MLLKLKDGGILDIKASSESWRGCETCDYGSCYTNEFTIILTTGKIEVKCGQMYEFPFQKGLYTLSDEYGIGNAPWSEGEVMKIILHNIDTISLMTEEEFVEWFKKELFSYSQGGAYSHREENYSFIKY